MALQSPFLKHRDKVLGYYSTASWLRSLVLSMWRGSAHKVGMSQLAGLDSEHTTAVFEMMNSYRQHGESDPAFMALAEECRQRQEEEQAAAEQSERLEDWCRDVQHALRQSGGRAGMVDDCYSWFSARFDAGDEPEHAARAAIEAKIDPALETNRRD